MRGMMYVFMATGYLRSIFTYIKKNPALLPILAAGLILRYFFHLSIDGPITTSDTPTYTGGAVNLYTYLCLSEYRPPVYPLGIMVVGILTNWTDLNSNVIVLQVLISMINIIFIYRLIVEAFGSKIAASLAAFIISINYKVFSWDFVILSENFSILIVTVITYYTIMCLKHGRKKDFYVLTVSLIAGIFTKPFFLMLPPLVFLVLITGRFFTFSYKIQLQKIVSGLAVIYFCVFAYSAVNYAENKFFGITTVGNVNYFGKILQYNLQEHGNNEALKEDLKRAFRNERPEYIVNGKYLEPWHFIGSYGWSINHYNEVGKFAKEIILNHPFRYINESIRLTYDLFVFKSPFKDFIAGSKLERSGHVHPVFSAVSKVTEVIDLFYVLLVLCLAEVVIRPLVSRRNKEKGNYYNLLVLMAVIIYHYVIAAFFSYGDYCRLLAPCYPLIYTVISLYVYRVAAFIYSGIKTVKI